MADQQRDTETLWQELLMADRYEHTLEEFGAQALYFATHSNELYRKNTNPGNEPPDDRHWRFICK